MSIIRRNKKQVILLLLCFLTSIPLIYKIGTETVSIRSENHELYESELERLNSIEKLLHYTDSLYAHTATEVFDTAAYVNLACDVTKKRFYFGLSNYTLSENWIAYLSGKLIWKHFLAIVEPDDILKHQEGLCSQQTIVFMELLKRKSINVRSVGLGRKEGPGHFLCEAQYQHDWHLYDVTIEPLFEIPKLENRSAAYYLNNLDTFYKAYNGRVTRDVFNKYVEKVAYGEVNQFPAKNMLLFHQVTRLIAFLLPFLFIILFLISLAKESHKRKNSLK